MQTLYLTGTFLRPGWGDSMEGVGQMKLIADTAAALWKGIKDLYNLYLMLLGMGIGAFCFFIDGNTYKKKGLNREKIAAKVTGLVLFVSAAVLYLLVIIF
jgi:hypothetical protein